MPEKNASEYCYSYKKNDRNVERKKKPRSEQCPAGKYCTGICWDCKMQKVHYLTPWVKTYILTCNKTYRTSEAFCTNIVQAKKFFLLEIYRYISRGQCIGQYLGFTNISLLATMDNFIGLRRCWENAVIFLTHADNLRKKAQQTKSGQLSYNNARCVFIDK